MILVLAQVWEAQGSGPTPLLPPVVRQGETPLQTAVLNHSLKEVELLLQKGGDIHEKDKSGKTLLLLAMPAKCPQRKSCFQISLGFWEMAIFLLNHGADPCVSDAQGVLPLDFASEDAPDELILLMIEKGAVLNEFIRDRMNKDSLFKGRVEMAQRFFQKNPQAVQFIPVYHEKYVFSDLHLALIRGDDTLAEKIIEKGGDVIHQPSSYGITPLHLSVYKGNPALVKLLIQKGADINIPAHWYRARRALTVFILLRDIVVNPTLDVRQQIRGIAFDVISTQAGYTPLMVAVLKQDLNMVKILLENGANINDVDEDKWSALHYAGYVKNIEIFNFLINNDADREAINIFDEKPGDYL